MREMLGLAAEIALLALAGGLAVMGPVAVRT